MMNHRVSWFLFFLTHRIYLKLYTNAMERTLVRLALRHVRKHLTNETVQTIACSSSRIDYCNSLLYGAPVAVVEKLQRAQINVARVISNMPTIRTSSSLPSTRRRGWRNSTTSRDGPIKTTWNSTAASQLRQQTTTHGCRAGAAAWKSAQQLYEDAGCEHRKILSISQHVQRLVTSSAQARYVLRVLRTRGLDDAALQHVFRATVVARLTYAVSAWRGLTKASDRQRISTPW